MNVFDLRQSLIEEYSGYISRCIQIRDQRIREYVDQQRASGLIWLDRAEISYEYSSTNSSLDVNLEEQA